MDESNGSKPICVVLDTNIWVYKTSLLRTVLGAALTNSVVRLGAVVGLPEVVDEEIVKHAVKFGTEAAARIRKDLERVEKLVGYKDTYSPPGEDRFEAGAKERLEWLQHLLKRVPYDFRQLRSALARVMDETPPNGYRNQQYKDSVMWEAVIELSNTYAVYFVTEDKDFFENKEPKTGVATNLRAECKREGRNISVYYGLESYLESIRGEVPPLDYAALATAVEREVIDALLGLASEQGFELHELIDSRISAFLTEKVDTLALSFELDHRATVMQPKTRLDKPNTQSARQREPGWSSTQKYFTIDKVTLQITWNNPQAIDYGTALSSTQLNAEANVLGSFAYNPLAGTVHLSGTRG